MLKTINALYQINAVGPDIQEMSACRPGDCSVNSGYTASSDRTSLEEQKKWNEKELYHFVIEYDD